jgi:rod shape-determining protein MreD
MPAERLPRTSIDRPPSLRRLIGIPVASIMLGSTLTLLPSIAEMPWLPPFGFMMLIAWRQVQRNLLPVWIGLPLGLFDDLLSGQPLGSAIFLWTLSFLILDMVDRRMVWREIWTEWGIASALLSLFLLAQLGLANQGEASTNASVIVPQMIISILAFPVIARLCETLDRLRRST